MFDYIRYYTGPLAQIAAAVGICAGGIYVDRPINPAAGCTDRRRNAPRHQAAQY